jgi:hypothetical protein
MGGLMQCWQDLAQYQQFLMCMLSQMGPIPFQGVTDGSNALAGNIGEFIQATGTVNYPASVTTTSVISVTVVPPGDWDFWGKLDLSAVAVVNSWVVTLSPLPAGMSNNMSGQVVPPELTSGHLNGARGSFSVPTLLAFSSTLNNTTAATGGTGTLTLEARRRR